MGARIRETRGVSYPDPRRPGARRWRSASVSVSAGWWLAGWLIWYGAVWPFALGPLWLGAEFILLALSAVSAAAGLRRRPGARLVLRRVRCFWLAGLADGTGGPA